MTARLEPPSWYDDERRAIWADTIRRLSHPDNGGIFRADPRLVDAYVNAAASHNQAALLVARTGVLVTRGPGRPPVENPALAVQRRAAADLAATSRALGLHASPMTAVLAESPMAAQRGRWCETHGRHECVKNRNRGGECHALPVSGLEVCKNHGGKSLAALKADGQAAIARLYGERAEVDPAGALLEEVQWAAGHVRALRRRVAEMAAEQGPDGEPGSALWWGVVRETDRGDGGTEREYRAGPHAILAAYSAERAHLVRAAAAAEAAGAHAEAVSVAKALGAGVHQLLDRIFRALELNDHQWGLVPQVVPVLLAEFDPAADGEEVTAGG